VEEREESPPAEPSRLRAYVEPGGRREAGTGGALVGPRFLGRFDGEARAVHDSRLPE
jgi:hypothetical protein